MELWQKKQEVLALARDFDNQLKAQKINKKDYGRESYTERAEKYFESFEEKSTSETKAAQAVKIANNGGMIIEKSINTFLFYRGRSEQGYKIKSLEYGGKTNYHLSTALDFLDVIAHTGSTEWLNHFKAHKQLRQKAEFDSLEEFDEFAKNSEEKPEDYYGVTTVIVEESKFNDYLNKKVHLPIS